MYTMKTRRRRRRRLPRIPNPGRPVCAPIQYKDATRIPNSCQTQKSVRRLYEKIQPRPLAVGVATTGGGGTTELWRQLTARFPDCRKEETCVVKKVMGELPTDMYGPAKPEGWNQPMGEDATLWTDRQVSLVMRQYEQAYPHFYFAPPSFINYDTMVPRVEKQECVTPALCQLSLADQKQKGKTDIGILFNTDTYGGEGEHWICVYICLPENSIVFFDSLGDAPPKEVMRFVASMKRQIPALRLTSIRETHQRLDGECGTYCVFVLLLLLTGTRHLALDSAPMSWKERIRFLKENRLDDAYIQVYRNYFMQGFKK